MDVGNLCEARTRMAQQHGNDQNMVTVCRCKAKAKRKKIRKLIKRVNTTIKKKEITIMNVVAGRPSEES